MAMIAICGMMVALGVSKIVAIAREARDPKMGKPSAAFKAYLARQ